LSDVEYFTSVPNLPLDEICQFNFSGAQLRIILKVWRMTYGYRRDDYELSVTFLHQETKLSESAVQRALAALIEMNVLLVTRKETQNSPRKLSFNKNYDQWNLKRGGESMEKPDGGVHDCPPQIDIGGVHDPLPRGVHDCPPQSNDFSYSGVADRPPIKEILRSLNISLKEKEILFDKFYSHYPRRISKEAAKKAWNKICKDENIDVELVINNTINFSDTCKLLETQTKFIPHPSTYLNQKRYEDYAVVDPEGLAAEKQTKIDSNLEFLRNQIGADQVEPGSSSDSLREGNGSLSEQCTGFEEEPPDI
jgi:phage replication O-like protein O